MPRLVIVLGPTAVGKTDWSIDLALHYGSPVISCDSRQIYREMRIGTARPDEAQLSRVRHYFIASHSVRDYYSAGLYEIEVLSLLEELFRSHDTLVMAGGTGLYIDAVCNGLDDFPKADIETRSLLMERLSKEGIESLRCDLLHLDPKTYHDIDLANTQRVVRALEVTISTGRPYSSYRTRPSKARPFEIEKIGLMRPREELYRRIDSRVDRMMEDGLEEEARGLYCLRDLPSLNTVGYREMFDYFDGKTDLREAVRLIKRNTRHYAKRQMTWWGRDDSIQWKNIE